MKYPPVSVIVPPLLNMFDTVVASAMFRVPDPVYRKFHKEEPFDVID